MGYQLEIRKLEYFIAVADTLHFKKASELLFISQPGLSKQIARLEDELGVSLFERNNRNVKLTEAGQYLRKEIGNSLNNIKEIFDHAKLIQEGRAGKIRIGYVGSAMIKIIPDLMMKFRKLHPSISFSLKELDNDTQVQSLLAQETDIGFVRMDKVPEGLSIRPIFQDTFSLVLPKNHKINQDNYKSLQQVKNESFILFNREYSPNYYNKIISLFDEAGFEPIISHTTVQAYSIFKLVEKGFGNAIVPTSLGDGYNLNIKFIEMKNVSQRAVLSVVWNSKNSNPVRKGILDFIPINDKAL